MLPYSRKKVLNILGSIYVVIPNYGKHNKKIFLNKINKDAKNKYNILTSIIIQ